MKIILLIPIYNDRESLTKLIENINFERMGNHPVNITHIELKKMLQKFCSKNNIPLNIKLNQINKKFVVDWNLLRRCNFSCTYCAPDIHDYDSEFPSMEQLQQEFNDIIVPDNRAVHFNLNGGEPTIHPDIMDILKMCHSKGTVEMLSNGTASVSKYNDILDYAKVNISLHHELINEKHMEKFIQNHILLRVF